MKRRLIVFFAVLAGLMGICASALALDDPLKVSMQLSESTFTSPQKITVSIQVTNTGDAELPGEVTLYYPSGKQVEEFGAPVLAAGTTKSWSGEWDVTQAQLESGRITFKIKYSIVGDDGEVVGKTKNFAKKIVYSGGVASIEVNRTIMPTTARRNQEVSVTYDVVNTGTVEITDVEITEDKSISSKKGTIDRIPAGQKASYTFTVKMGTKTLTSKSTISYTAAGKTQKVTKEAAKIKYGDVKLAASLSADKKGGVAGEKVKLTLELKNTGKTDYHDVGVTDATLGEVFSGQTVAAGKTVKLEKEVVMADSVDYQFIVRGNDDAGNVVETASERVSLTAVSPDQVVGLQVRATVDSEVVYELPSIVKFRVYVTNSSEADVKNVSVSSSGKTLYTFPTILAGETRDFTRDVEIRMAGQYQFTASARDQLNQLQTFTSNIVPIEHAAPTPAPTLVPIVAPTQPQYEAIPTEAPTDLSAVQTALKIVSLAAVLLALAGVALCVTSVVRHTQIKKHSEQAKEHFDVPSVRNYTQQRDADEENEENDEDELEMRVYSNRGRMIGEDREADDLPTEEDVAANQSQDDAEDGDTTEQ